LAQNLNLVHHEFYQNPRFFPGKPTHENLLETGNVNFNQPLLKLIQKFKSGLLYWSKRLSQSEHLSAYSVYIRQNCLIRE
jgi:hypothetical protein